MACESLITLVKNCGTEGLIAGVSKLYMISAKDLKPVSGVTGSAYSVGVNGNITGIGLMSGKTFVQIGTIKNSVGLNEEGVYNDNGTNYSTETLTVRLTDISSENKAFVKSVSGQEVAAIVLSKSGKYYAVGLNGNMKISAKSGGLGLAEGDDIGYNLTFLGASADGLMIVEPSVIATAIS